MYAVSQRYIDAMRKPVQRHRIKGTIGNVPFTQEHILSGSFTISGQCSDNSMVQIGQVYTTELKITLLRKLGLYRYTVKGMEVAPHFGLYTNTAYLLAGMLSYRQLATMGKLAAGAVQREVLRKKGVDEDKIMGLIQPIALETLPVGNASGNYQVYLMTTLIPGIIALMAMLHTAYVIGRERQERTLRNWMRKAGNNALKAFLGKMAPYTFHYSWLLLLAEIIMYGPMHFPMEGSWLLLMLLSVLLIVAAQCAGCFLMGCIPDPSVAMSLTSAYGTLAFTMCGFSFPVDAMPLPMQLFSLLFPLRHYFLAMRDVTLFGNGLAVCWPQVAILAAFSILLLIGAWMFNRQYERGVAC